MPAPRMHNKRAMRTFRGAAGAALLTMAIGAGLTHAASARAASDAIIQPQTADQRARSFSGKALSAPVIDADAVLQADRAWTWAEAGAQRLVLERDVQIRIDGHEFDASRAVVWIESRLDDAGVRVRQIAAFLEDVETPQADAAIAQRARRLLVTAAIRGEVRLRVAALIERAAPEAGLREAEVRLAAYLADLARDRTPIAQAGGVQQLPQAGPRPPAVSPEPLPPTTNLAASPAGEPIFDREGVVTFSAPTRTLITGKVENALVLSGGVAAQYAAPMRERSLEFSAESAVVFTAPKPVSDILRFGPGEILGVYLEDGVVASDGDYTLRGPRMYYDFVNNRAVVLDGVYYTFDERAGVPVYARARAIRQESDSQWTAGDVQLANSAFYQPQFTIGATSVTITRAPSEGGERARTFVDARGVSLRYRGQPILPLPDYRGEAAQAPITQASVETRAGRPIIRTRWDIPSLLGVSAPEGLQADLLLDGHLTRGPAGGVDLRWAAADAEGAFFGYMMYDNGEDRFSSGAEINRENDFRGVVLAEHRWRLNDRWSLFLEGAHISDEAFIDAFFPELGKTRREFTNSFYVRRLDDASLFSLEVRGSFNDFTPNNYLLESQGFQVDRLPEIRYARPADALFGGAVVYSSDTRFGAVRLNLVEPRAREFGFDTRRRSRAAFGLLPGESLADRLRAQGFPTDIILRFDTRSELSIPLRVGPANVAPYVVGRLTAYDSDFDEFRNRAGFPETDSIRLRGEAGVRASTSIVRVDDTVESRLFDLHRIRHIIEPSATLWTSAESVDSASLPPFDEDVERLADGSGLRVGVANTWQTKRPDADGALHSVDWLTLRTDYVFASDDVNRQSPIPRFFDSRPELSNLGEHARADLSWRLTNALTLVSTGVYDAEIKDIAAASGGFLLDHGDGFSSFFEARSLESVGTLFLDFGAAYELTPKYALRWSAVWDTKENGFQSARALVERRFAQWTLEIGVDYDDIRQDVSFGFFVRPAGIGPARRARIFTREPDTGAPERFRPVRAMR